MRLFQSRQFILLFVAFAVAAGSLLVAGSALAEMALFRVERSFHNFPNPAVTSPGGAGMYQGYLQPYVTPWYSPPATAVVEPGNPVGGAFTLPQSFISYNGVFVRYFGHGGYSGYTTFFQWSKYNGPGKFRPNNGATGPTRIVLPTTMGNPYPTYTSTDQKWINGNDGDGNPVTPTTTFDGRYDMSRGGSITVTPGPRRFGGTMRVFHRPEAFWYQYVYYFTPAIYKVYANYICLDEGKFGCTPSTFVSDIGDTTAYWRATWYRLNVDGTGSKAATPPYDMSNGAKATTPTTPNGKAPTPYGNASFITGMRQYLNRIHPWTTGFAKVHNAKGSVWRTNDPGPITPQAHGYDISLGGADITVTHHDWNSIWNQQLSTITYTTETYKQYLFGVGRVVSMVRPKLIHDYNVPVDPDSGPITNIWQAARLSTLKVFFVPEPTGMLLLGSGLALLVVLHRASRRG